MITINKVNNGYILLLAGNTLIFKEDELEGMFRYLLQDLTGRTSYFSYDKFAEVAVNFNYDRRLTTVEYRIK